MAEMLTVTSQAGTGPPLKRTALVRPLRKANVQNPSDARLYEWIGRLTTFGMKK